MITLNKWVMIWDSISKTKNIRSRVFWLNDDCVILKNHTVIKYGEKIYKWTLKTN